MVEGWTVGIVVAVSPHAVPSGPRVRHTNAQAYKAELLSLDNLNHHQNVIKLCGSQSDAELQIQRLEEVQKE